MVMKPLSDNVMASPIADAASHSWIVRTVILIEFLCCSVGQT